MTFGTGELGVHTPWLRANARHDSTTLIGTYQQEKTKERQMPIYEYQCTDCAGEFEKLMRFEDPVPDCPSCGGAPKRQISAASFVLKGGGWERDGYGAGSRQVNPQPRTEKKVDTNQIPYVARDGSVMNANGTKMLNPDGSKA
jgi:putative FmdB family regulatory protein